MSEFDVIGSRVEQPRYRGEDAATIIPTRMRDEERQPGAFGHLAERTNHIAANACRMEHDFRKAMDRLGLFPMDAGPVPSGAQGSPDKPANLVLEVSADLSLTESALANMSGLIEVLERATDR